MKVRTDSTTSNHQIDSAPQSPPLNWTLSPEIGAATPQTSHELSGLTAPPHRRSTPPTSPSSSDEESVGKPPMKRMRLNGVLPPRTERPEPSLSTQASRIGAISSTAAGSARLGGKVIDVPGLRMHERVPGRDQTVQMESAIKDALKAQHGPVEVFGYHVTSEENAIAIRDHGFSADKNQGQAGGVAGVNIHGPGLYTSRRPVDSYVMPDRTNIMYAVVHPKSVPFQQAVGGTGVSWDAASNAATLDDGDFIQSMSDERKINPNAISKVGLIPVARIPPSMPPELLAARQQMLSKPAPPRTVSADLHNWVSGAIKNDPALKDIEAETDSDKKLELIDNLAIKLDQHGDKHAEASQRLLMMDLKKRYMPPN
jgi:hypothetical protein